MTSITFPGSNKILLPVLACAALILGLLYLLYSPAVPVLPPRFDGAWIRPNMPVNLGIYKNKISRASFRKRLELSAPGRSISMSITAYRNVAMFLDGREIRITPPGSWKQPIRVTLPAELLTTGPHEIRLEVSNRMAHPAVHIAADNAALAEIAGWESSLDGAGWLQALACDGRWDLQIRHEFPTVYEWIKRTLPLLVPLALISLALSFLPARLVAKVGHPRNLRYLLLLLWVVLGCNNMFKIPLNAGFDARHHYDYVFYLLENHRLPLATEGLQMFQPPAFYLIAAAFYKAVSLFSPRETADYLLRIIPLLSGLVLIETTGRILRTLFPQDDRAQSCGLIIGALLPMNLYMCHYVGNEPLTGALTAMALYLAVRMFTRNDAVSPGDAALLGAVTGAAIITKVTPILLVPVIAFFLLLNSRERSKHGGSWWKSPLLFLMATGLVSAWYFARNWILLGKPFFGGWDPERNIVWWQAPSFRLFRDFHSFGESLSQPVYACFNGFADALYSTFWHDGYLSGKMLKATASPWNYDLLAAGTAFSLVPFSAMAMGALITFHKARDNRGQPLTFFLAAIIVYLAALLYLYATLPIYSTAKASYTMGLTPCYAAMAAVGAHYLLSRRYLGNLFMAMLTTWAVITYCGFFVV